MHLEFTEQEQAFREEVRRFLRERIPADIRDKVQRGCELAREDYLMWQRRLYERGWGAMDWPLQFGGSGWNAVQQYIYEEEAAQAGAPGLIPFGLKMVAPVLMAFGSAAQQATFLPKILRGETWWCQGYSEPGAGSDLASLRTRAARDGDHYVVNGQKTWNTLGHYADWIFCLVRTDPQAKAQSGITFLLIDMKSPGVSVRPIALMDGGREVNDIWFEDVRVPLENRVGEENRGWTYAKFLLGHERTLIAGVGTAKRALARLKRVAGAQRNGNGVLLDDPLFAARVRKSRDRAGRSRDHQSAGAVRRAKLAGAGTASLDAENQGERDPAGHFRAADARRRSVRAADAARGHGGRLAGGPGLPPRRRARRRAPRPPI